MSYLFGWGWVVLVIVVWALSQRFGPALKAGDRPEPFTRRGRYWRRAR